MLQALCSSNVRRFRRCVRFKRWGATIVRQKFEPYNLWGVRVSKGNKILIIISFFLRFEASNLWPDRSKCDLHWNWRSTLKVVIHIENDDSRWKCRFTLKVLVHIESGRSMPVRGAPEEALRRGSSKHLLERCRPVDAETASLYWRLSSAIVMIERENLKSQTRKQVKHH